MTEILEQIRRECAAEALREVVAQSEKLTGPPRLRDAEEGERRHYFVMQVVEETRLRLGIERLW